jgi:hypothetical protein
MIPVMIEALGLSLAGFLVGLLLAYPMPSGDSR